MRGTQRSAAAKLRLNRHRQRNLRNGRLGCLDLHQTACGGGGDRVIWLPEGCVFHVGSRGLVFGWGRQFCVRSDFSDSRMGDSPPDIMFVHSGIFSFFTAIFLNYSGSCSPSRRHTKYACAK
jgi:hypothetical protein